MQVMCFPNLETDGNFASDSATGIIELDEDHTQERVAMTSKRFVIFWQVLARAYQLIKTGVHRCVPV